MSERQPCRVCGKKLLHLSQHERTQHGIYQRGPKAKASQAKLSRAANAARAREAKAEKRAAALAHTEVVTAPLHVNGGNPFVAGAPQFQVMPFVVLGTDDGGIWLAERIK